MKGGPSFGQRKSFSRDMEAGKHEASLGNKEELGWSIPAAEARPVMCFR